MQRVKAKKNMGWVIAIVAAVAIFATPGLNIKIRSALSQGYIEQQLEEWIAKVNSIYENAKNEVVKIYTAGDAITEEENDKKPLIFKANNHIVYVGQRDDKCEFSCVLVDGKEVISNDYISVVRVLPDKRNPQFILLTNDCGGSSCGRSRLDLIDISGAMPIIQSNIPLLVSNNSFTGITTFNDSFIDFSGPSVHENELGDMVEETYRYDRKMHETYLLNNKSASYIKLVGQHPDTIFSAPETREKLLALLGDDFVPVRKRVQVASSIEIKYYRYLVASGIMPHSGGSDEAIVVLDMANGDMWAYWVESSKKFELRGRALTWDMDFDIKIIMDDWLSGWKKHMPIK